MAKRTARRGTSRGQPEALAENEVTPGVIETLFACAWAIPFVVIIPWRALLRALVASPEPWTRRATDARVHVATEVGER